MKTLLTILKNFLVGTAWMAGVLVALVVVLILVAVGKSLIVAYFGIEPSLAVLISFATMISVLAGVLFAVAKYQDTK